MSRPLAWLDGRWISAAEAVVPVADAGFVQGVTVAEQLRTFAGRIFRLDAHLARLDRSRQIVGVEINFSLAQLTQAAAELVAHNYRLLAPGDDLGLSIFVTPGAYPAYDSTVSGAPLICMHTYRLPFHLWAEKYRSGQALVITEIEQVPASCWPPSLKCRSRMHYYLADRRAASIDPQARALLLDRNGFVTETSTANVLLFNADEGLVSPPLETILHGISLDVTMELARQCGIRCTFRPLTVADLVAADEIILTSTPFCLLPVVRLDGQTIGAGQPGVTFRRLLAAWSELVGVDILAQADGEGGQSAV